MQSIYFSFSGSFSESLLQELAEYIKKSLQSFEFNSFLVGCSFPYSLSEDEKSLLKKEFHFALVKKLESVLEKKPDFSNPHISITIDFNARKINWEIRSVFIEGNYNKFSRKIAQTIFFCPKCKGNGCAYCRQKGKLGLESVEELIGKPAQKLFQASSFLFHGSGREDVDVCMLGNGRGFVLELLGPKKRLADLKKLEIEINKTAKKKISVHSLVFSNKKRVIELKEKRSFKKYHCIIDCSKPILETKLKELVGKEWVVLQQTPLRVIKRRSDLERKRTVKIVSIQKKSKKQFEVTVLAEAGLYIKEFVNGDSNRTKPNFSSLLENDCSCTQLDVIEILDP
ncbi:tRNA pseudouridine(54/55) synthase Pus10 [Candidatus Micrarchaeota archaeon]|nr:tRNA pseudouridine(54/55) synthase Pus10 [Candidatus Micrarchaeota archaeon]MBU1930243.1 tRNA pseudouridine(54/55) synthase Pus10 [Candidatus Micrarchaeota archaeon]